MRVLIICGAALIGLSGPAIAGGDILRGSQEFEVGAPIYSRWDGVYGGLQGGYMTTGADFGNGVNSLVSYILRNTVLQDDVSSWTTLPKADTTGWSYGAFAGYNFQWENVVIGVEANYNRMSQRAGATDSIGPLLISDSTGAPAGHTYTYSVQVAANASIKLTDVATFRGRMGWAAGDFMPYAFVGLAVGRADVTRWASVTGTRTDNWTDTTTVIDPFTGFPITTSTPRSSTTTLLLPSNPQSETQSGVFAYGYSAGIGVDFALIGSLFMRGEWEWVQFAPIKDIKVHTNTARAALGLRF
jgi:opacity protein-like surface antigen